MARLKFHGQIFLPSCCDLPAHDLIGHECVNDKEARDHGSFIAHRIGTEKPGMIREVNYIAVTDDRDREIFQIPLASTTV
jgi:hypothetical protein